MDNVTISQKKDVDCIFRWGVENYDDIQIYYSILTGSVRVSRKITDFTTTTSGTKGMVFNTLYFML